MRAATHWQPGPRIYNLFPLLAGPLPAWQSHLERAHRLGFNWVFINAFFLSGYSGSLYAVKDYYAVDPRFLAPEAGSPQTQLQQMIRTAKQLDLKLMLDLVINHTAFDSILVEHHPEWYKRGADGELLHPSAKEDDAQVVWGDLAEIDNTDSPDRDRLWQYWLTLARHYAAVGFDGFRCDAAYKVPVALWQFLIGRVKHSYPDTLFFAESLGCPPKDLVRLAQSDFDFLFNSSKWWDFFEPWCLDQYRRTAPFAPSLSFPESHDTERLAAELEEDQAAVKQRYVFSALFSTGVMMPIGFEYGFRRRLNVVATRPEDWEQPEWDLCDFITAVNHLKASQRVFNEEGPIEPLGVDNPEIVAFIKSSLDETEKALVLLNTDRQRPQSCSLAQLAHIFPPTTPICDLSPEGWRAHSPDFHTCQLNPSGINVLHARLSKVAI